MFFMLNHVKTLFSMANPVSSPGASRESRAAFSKAVLTPEKVAERESAKRASRVSPPGGAQVQLRPQNTSENSLVISMVINM